MLFDFSFLRFELFNLLLKGRIKVKIFALC